MSTVDYQLPDGRIVAVPFDVCRAASTIDYTLASGQIVLAVIAPPAACTCGHAWRRHTRQRNGAHACQYFGCGCRDVVLPYGGTS